MKPKPFSKAFCISIGVLLVSLLTANQIVSFFVPSSMKRIRSLPQTEDEVFFWIDKISFTTNSELFDSFYLSGWSFCETKEDNTNRELLVILANDRDVYSSTLQNWRNYRQGRPDVERAFPDLSIPSNNLGFKNLLLSTVGMRNGIYDLYLFCKENEANSGIVNTGIRLEKTVSGIHRYE